MSSALLFRDDAYLRTATATVLAVGERGIELDRTLFYPQGGGQAGDTGRLVRSQGEPIAIADTRKGDTPDRVLHVPAAGGPVRPGGDPAPPRVCWLGLNPRGPLPTPLHPLGGLPPAGVTGEK